MSTEEIEEFFVHTVTVETYLGTNGYGEDVFDTPVSVDGFLLESRRLVRDKTGAQVVSGSTFHAAPADAAQFLPDSKVTVNGNATRVITCALNTSGDLDLPDHMAAALT